MKIYFHFQTEFYGFLVLVIFGGTFILVYFSLSYRFLCFLVLAISFYVSISNVIMNYYSLSKPFPVTQIYLISICFIIPDFLIEKW